MIASALGSVAGVESVDESSGVSDDGAVVWEEYSVWATVSVSSASVGSDASVYVSGEDDSKAGADADSVDVYGDGSSDSSDGNVGVIAEYEW